MSVTHDQIAESLIGFYKSQGLDTTYLLGDPLFQKLKPEEKVKFVQAHAKELHEGSRSGWLPGDYKQMALGAVTGAIAGTLPNLAGVLMSSAPKSYKQAFGMSSLSTALALGAAGAMVSGLGVRESVQARQALRDQMSLAAANPTVMNAVGVLAATNTHALRFGGGRALVNLASKIEADVKEPAQMATINGADRINQALIAREQRLAAAAP